MKSITCPKFRFPEAHWFIESTTSAKVTTSHGGSFPFMMHGPVSVVVVVVCTVVDVVVEVVAFIEVVVEEVLVVLIEDVVVDDVVVVSAITHSIISTETPHLAML
jgi:hypothetical protein